MRPAWAARSANPPKRRASSTAAFSRMRGSRMAGAKAISSPATSARAGSRSIARSSPGSRRRARTLRSRSRFRASGSIHHFDDFRWLVDQRNSGALDILWTDHTYHHPYHRKLPDDANFLLSKGVDPQEEILDTERLLIANGETPSLFFRFPGLVSSDPLMQAVSQFHLVTLGADAWLALGQKPGRGSIVLVHPNGNEPKGLALFSSRPRAWGNRRPARAPDRRARVDARAAVAIAAYGFRATKIPLPR